MPKKARRPLRVLFVGKTEENGSALQEALGHPDYDLSIEPVHTEEMMAAALGRQAWEIVLAEDTVPGFGATAALALLQRTKTDLPIILVSKDQRPDAALAAVRTGFHDFLAA